MMDFYTVISDSPVWVRKEPSQTSKPIGLVYPNNLLKVVNKQDGFVRISKGWVSEFTADGKTRLISRTSPSVLSSINLMSLSTEGTNPNARDGEDQSSDSSSDSENGEQSTDDSSSNDEEKDKKKIEKGSLVYDTLQKIKEWSADVNTDETIAAREAVYQSMLSNLDIRTTMGIYGLPYQWMNHVDPRPKGVNTDLGRVYSERIMGRIPLMLIAPGEPDFLAGFSNDDKSAIVSALTGVVSAISSDIKLDKLVSETGKYYSFKYAGNIYWDYVNPIMQSAAYLMGLEDYTYGLSDDGSTLSNTPLSDYDWSKNYSPKVYQYWRQGGQNCISFYIESETQISDNFSNEDTQSQLASKVNGFSDMARELQFLLGGTKSALGFNIDKDKNAETLKDNQNLGDTMGSMFSDMGAFSNFMRQITGGFQTVLNGGKLIFPNIWSDSSFFKTYDVTFKFVIPDYDDYSWYVGILAPLVHLLCLTLPRQSGPNGYISPFLVKAFYKGLFNCEMGLITSLNVTKGSEGGWTKSGLPTSVNVSMTIKDLYSNMAITATDAGSLTTIVSNTIFMDYLSNLCGVNISEPTITKKVIMIANLLGHKIGSYISPSRLYGALSTEMLNRIASWNLFR